MRDLTRRSVAIFQLVSVAIVLLFCSTAIGTILISEAGNLSIGIYLDGSTTNVGQTDSMASANKILFWTQIAPVNQEAAIQAGTIDGGVSWEPFCSVQVNDNTAKILTRSGNIMPNHPSDLLAVHYNTLFSDNETNHQLVARVVRAHLEATDWIIKTINEGEGANYTILVQMAAQFTGLSQSVIQTALEYVGYKYAINQAYKDGLADFTSMFANLSEIVGFGGYSNAMDFANGITNTSYQEMSSSLSPSSTIVGTVRIGDVMGNLRSLAEVVAKNSSLWGGKDLFQVWGVDVTSPIPYANGGQEMDAFAAGNIDMGYLGCAAAILRCINANIPIEIVSAANTEGSAILVRPDITSLDDLNLRTLATPGPGSIEHLLLLKWAAMNGFEVHLKGTVEVPSAPRDSNATASDGRITLRWLEPENAGGTSITNYTIYRGVSSGGESILTTIGANLSFVDSSVIQGSTYYYKVSAVNLVGEGAQSNETSARVDLTDTTPPVVSFIIQCNGTNVITALTNQILVFTANATFDDNDTFNMLNFTWSFGDSTTGYGPWVRHDFAMIKTFSVKLSARDSVGNVANLTKSLIITSSPVPDLHIVSMNFSPSVFTVGVQGTIIVNVSNVGNDFAVQPHLEFYMLNSNGTKSFIGNETSFMVNETAATDLNPGQYGLFTFGWTPSTGGNYTFQVKAVVDREINLADNTDTGTVNVVSPIDFTLHNSGKGYSILVPTHWTVREDANASGIIVDTLILGPISDGVQTNIIVMTGIDASITDSQAYLNQFVQATVNYLTLVGAKNVTMYPPASLYSKISGNSAVVFGVFFSLPGFDLYQKTAFVIDAVHNLYWTVTCTVCQQSLSLFNPTFNAMINGFITNPLPSPPQNVTATPGNQRVVLTWNAPVENGSGTITKYNVYRSTTEAGTYYLIASPAGQSFTDTGLVNGQNYCYKVSAVSNIGEGVITTPVSSMPFTVPVAPTNLVAVAGNMQVSLNWTAPVFDGGRIIDYYIIYQDGVALPDHPAGLTDTINGLSNGENFSFEVAPHNVAGIGVQSSPVLSTPRTVPNAPIGLATTTGNAQVTLNWTAPSNDGGALITVYRIYRSATINGTYVLIASHSALNYTDSGNLTNGQTYWYKVSAINVAGEGVMSATFSVNVPQPFPIWILVVAVIVIGVALVALLFVFRKREVKK